MKPYYQDDSVTPEPSPALVDTIARAIAGIDGYGPDLGDDTQSPHEYWYGEVRGKYRDQARAALAAMTQPIGYVAVRSNGTETWTPGWVSDKPTADRIAGILSSKPGQYTVAALIPVGEMS